MQSGAPFDAEGVPRRRLTLLDKGSIRDIGEETFDAVLPAMKVHDFHLTEVTRF